MPYVDEQSFSSEVELQFLLDHAVVVSVPLLPDDFVGVGVDFLFVLVLAVVVWGVSVIPACWLAGLFIHGGWDWAELRPDEAALVRRCERDGTAGSCVNKYTMLLDL